MNKLNDRDLNSNYKYNIYNACRAKLTDYNTIYSNLDKNVMSNNFFLNSVILFQVLSSSIYLVCHENIDEVIYLCLFKSHNRFETKLGHMGNGYMNRIWPHGGGPFHSSCTSDE
jgi:hypothetical protein